MLILTINQNKEIPVGGTVVWDTVNTNCVNDAKYKDRLYVRLNRCGMYDIYIQGNVSGTDTTQPISLDLQTNGYIVPYGNIRKLVVAASMLDSVSRYIPLNNCPDTNQLNLINTGTTPVTLGPGFSMIVVKHQGG